MSAAVKKPKSQKQLSQQRRSVGSAYGAPKDVRNRSRTNLDDSNDVGEEDYTSEGGVSCWKGPPSQVISSVSPSAKGTGSNQVP